MALEHNTFAYCKNKPVLLSDHSGNSAKLAADIAKGSWRLGAGIAMTDTLLPGPADAIGVAVGVLGTIAAGGVLAWSAITGMTSVQDVVVEATETSEKENPSERRPYLVTAAYGDGPLIPLSSPLSMTEAQQEIEPLMVTKTVQQALLDKGHQVLDTKDLHVGIYSVGRTDAYALAKKYNKTLTIDRFGTSPNSRFFPHYHLTPIRTLPLAKIHIWFFNTTFVVRS